MKFNIENLKKHICMMIGDATDVRRMVEAKALTHATDFYNGRHYELNNKLINLNDILDFVKEIEFGEANEND